MKFILAFSFALFPLFAEWIMFSDSKDTYIYNNISGDIYIRHNKGGNNYEDNFIKMPSGIIPNATPSPNKNSKQENTSIPQNELLNKLENLQKNALDSIME